MTTAGTSHPWSRPSPRPTASPAWTAPTRQPLPAPRTVRRGPGQSVVLRQRRQHHVGGRRQEPRLQDRHDGPGRSATRCWQGRPAPTVGTPDAVTASFTATDATSGVYGTNPKTTSTGTAQGVGHAREPRVPRRCRQPHRCRGEVLHCQGGLGRPLGRSWWTDRPTAASYYFGSVPGAPTCTASDATSVVAGPCTISGYNTSVGAHTVTATARDSAGNVTIVKHDYSVLAWATKGYYSPVDPGGVWNSVKGGATVPLKFEVFAGPRSSRSTSVREELRRQGGRLPELHGVGRPDRDGTHGRQRACGTTRPAVSSSRTGRPRRSRARVPRRSRR